MPPTSSLPDNCNTDDIEEPANVARDRRGGYSFVNKHKAFEQGRIEVLGPGALKSLGPILAPNLKSWA